MSESVKFPVAYWRDPSGNMAGSIVHGPRLSVVGKNKVDLNHQLTKAVFWLAKKDELKFYDSIEETEAIVVKVPIRPVYEMDGRNYSQQDEIEIELNCVLTTTSEGIRTCWVAQSDSTFSYYESDDPKKVVPDHFIQVIGKRVTKDLLRFRRLDGFAVDNLHVRMPRPRKQTEIDWNSPLHQHAVRIDQKGILKRFPHSVGREELIQDLGKRLQDPERNIVLVGPSGIGKSTVLFHAIRQLNAGLKKNRPTEVVENPLDHYLKSPQQFWQISGSRIIAGMKYLGQWEERFEQVINDTRQRRGTLCFENLHELVRLGGRDANSSVASFLIPFLTNRDLRIVAEATRDELKVVERLLPALVQQLEVIEVPEFRNAERKRVFADFVVRESQRYRVLFAEKNQSVLLQLFDSFAPYETYPGKITTFAKRLMRDLSPVHRKTNASLNADDLGESRSEVGSQIEVTRDHVIQRFSTQTGLPQSILRDEETVQFEDVRNWFSARVLGQDLASDQVARLFIKIKSGMVDPKRPCGVLMFCGPTGVGKTEMAKQIAQYLFGSRRENSKKSDSRLVQLDMSEYSGVTGAERLLMQPDGEPSQLIKSVRRQPFSVVLLDEIEKASPAVFDVLLGMLDEGRITDRFGRTTFFRSCIIIMTTNLGVRRTDPVGFSGGANEFLQGVRAAFRPEFFNRLDYVIPFQNLPRPTIRLIAEKELRDLEQREALRSRSLSLSWTSEVIERLVDEGYDAQFGARPLQRAVERLVVAAIAKALLESSATTGSSSERFISLSLDTASAITANISNGK